MTTPNRLDPRSAYLYLVCLVTLVMIIFAAVSLTRNAVELAYPDNGAYASAPAYGPEAKGTVSPEDRRKQQDAFQDEQRRQAVLGLVGAAAMLVLAGPTYLYHWRRVEQGFHARGGAEPLAAGDA